MAYPTGIAYQHIGTGAGFQPISETSTTQRHRIGTVSRAVDPVYGEGTFIYLKGAASTAPGDFVTYESDAGVTTRATSAGGAGVGTGAGAVAMSANVANQYGWYLVEGMGPVATGTVADNAALYLSITAGSLSSSSLAADLVDGIRAKAATSGGFTTCQLNRPNVSGLTSVSTQTQHFATLSANAEAGDAIVVDGQVYDSSGAAVASAVEVMVETLAVTADKGDITVTVGTEMKTVNAAAGKNISWITTTAAGAFSVSVANDVAEVTLISATPANGLTQHLVLTFAA